MPSAQVNLANAERALAAQQALNNAVGARLTVHNGRIIGLRTDVDRTAAVVAAQAAQSAIQDGRITQLGDNQAGLDERVTGLEALNHEIDWFGSAVITAVVGVISAVCFYIMVFSARWDPLLAVEGGNDGVITDAARSIMNYHVVAYTIVVMAFTFAACVCLLGKRKPASRPTSTTTAPAPAQEPTEVVQVVEAVQPAAVVVAQQPASTQVRVPASVGAPTPPPQTTSEAWWAERFGQSQ
jgi:flagellar basal body-associated protein FliL